MYNLRAPRGVYIWYSVPAQYRYSRSDAVVLSSQDLDPKTVPLSPFAPRGPFAPAMGLVGLLSLAVGFTLRSFRLRPRA